MKASELIAVLSNEIGTYGDCEVTILIREEYGIHDEIHAQIIKVTPRTIQNPRRIVLKPDTI